MFTRSRAPTTYIVWMKPSTRSTPTPRWLFVKSNHAQRRRRTSRTSRRSRRSRVLPRRLEETRGDELLGEPLHVGASRGFVDVILGEDDRDRFIRGLPSRELVPDRRADWIEGEVRADAEVQHDQLVVETTG